MNDKNAQAVTEASENSFSSAMETENVPAVVKPKSRGGSKKAKQDDSDDDDDEDFDIPDLRALLAKHDIDSSPDHSDAKKTEVPQEPAGKKEPSKRAAAAKKKPVISLSEISESIGEIDINDEDLEVEEVAAAPEGGKKGGRKPAANSKAAKPPAAAKKRGPAAGKQSQAQQKLLTEMLKPAAEGSGISPDKQVRKMRASPFNKKSGSVLGRVGISKELETITDSEETFGSASMSENNGEEVTEVIQPRSRPQRANRKQSTYVLSDSETDNATEDSDFEEDED
ncbi:hypothetical protein REPUB_Repub03eG0204900 [Reevesia pubescens]